MYYHMSQFVQVTSSRVGVCGIEPKTERSGRESYRPILVPSNRASGMDESHDYGVNPRDIEILHLIDLEPNRRNVTISVEDAQLFEVEVL
jgi:hypothetical protein